MLDLASPLFPCDVHTAFRPEAKGAHLSSGLALWAVWGAMVYFLQGAVTAAFKK